MLCSNRNAANWKFRSCRPTALSPSQAIPSRCEMRFRINRPTFTCPLSEGAHIQLYILQDPVSLYIENVHLQVSHQKIMDRDMNPFSLGHEGDFLSQIF